MGRRQSEGKNSKKERRRRKELGRNGRKESCGMEGTTVGEGIGERDGNKEEREGVRRAEG